MDFLNAGIPLGRVLGIQVRLHFTFLLYAWYRLQQFPNLFYGAAFLAGLYVCILLHELGHALAARWADGEAREVLLWPLGGLACCRPAWHPTAHLMTTLAGPFVTLALFLLLAAAAVALSPWATRSAPVSYAHHFLADIARLNLWLLLFNLIPAFPMDGGRILRDTLWHWMSVETATRIAVWTSRGIAVSGIVWGLVNGFYWLVVLAAFVFLQAQQEYAAVAFERSGPSGFSLEERLRRGRRQRLFAQCRRRVASAESAAFHRCVICGRTERDNPLLEFRVCPNCNGGEEYCLEHLESHPHR